MTYFCYIKLINKEQYVVKTCSSENVYNLKMFMNRYFGVDNCHPGYISYKQISVPDGEKPPIELEEYDTLYLMEKVDGKRLYKKKQLK